VTHWAGIVLQYIPFAWYSVKLLLLEDNSLCFFLVNRQASQNGATRSHVCQRLDTPLGCVQNALRWEQKEVRVEFVS